MVVSSRTRRMCISVSPLLLIVTLITLYTASVTASEESNIRANSTKPLTQFFISDGLTTQDLDMGISPGDLATVLAGNGISITNVIYSGTNNAAGLFNGGIDIIGFANGVILSSGTISNVIGPNIEDFISMANGSPPDMDLTMLITPTIAIDASILEFDFVPDGNQVFFQYVFGSDEYNESVIAPYEDVFGAFIDGQNCALVGADYISIHTIHNGPTNNGPGSHPELYRNNDDMPSTPINTEADGLTVVLTCGALVTANNTYHIKFAIADGALSTVDSWVFLKAGSLTTDISISLAPDTGKLCVDNPYEIVASIIDIPQENILVSFEVVSGPNDGLLGSVPTNISGQATISYTSTLSGTDMIQASFVDSNGQPRVSELIEVHWSPCLPPTFTPTPTPTPTSTLTPTITPTFTPTPTPTPTPTVTITPTITTTPIPGCELYPIALHANTLIGVAPGDIIPDILNGNQPGNFGWLSWTGNMSQGALVTSLTPPGDSDTYINPNDPGDHVISIGDWIRGRPGVANSNQVRQALDNLMNYDIIIPVWDTSQGNGSNAQYHTVDFAQVHITDYYLPGQNRISVIFQGYVQCNVGNSGNSFSLDIERSK